MGLWKLVVETPTKEHEITVGKDEAVAVEALGKSKDLMGINGKVTVVDRLVVDGRNIVSLRIYEAA
jgi:hypothetical protein